MYLRLGGTGMSLVHLTSHRGLQNLGPCITILTPWRPDPQFVVILQLGPFTQAVDLTLGLIYSSCLFVLSLSLCSCTPTAHNTQSLSLPVPERNPGALLPLPQNQLISSKSDPK